MGSVLANTLIATLIGLGFLVLALLLIKIISNKIKNPLKMKGKIIATYADGTKHQVSLQTVLDDMVRDEMHENQLDYSIAKENVMSALRNEDVSLVRHSENMAWEDLGHHIKQIKGKSSMMKQKFAWKNAQKEVIHEQL